MRKILLTGAAGRVGSDFRKLEGHRYQLRLAEKKLESLGAAADHEELLAFDCADLDACQNACQGIDAVVHLAADPSPAADFYDSLLDNNIKAMYNIFRAAKDQGCSRVIWASSVQAIEGYPADVQVRPEMPPKPRNMYAATKVFGEATAHYFAYSEGLSSIAIRIGAFEGNRDSWEGTPDARTLCTFVSRRDLSHLIVRCIEVEDVQYAVVQACSDNRFKRMDITSTREILGYSPQDDAFALFNSGIAYRERWYEEWGRGA